MINSLFPYLVQLGDTAGGEMQTIEMTTSAGYDFIDLANKAVAYAILLAGFLSVVFMFYGGIMFILSGGKEDKVKQAIHTIRYAIMGLVITILSVTIISLIGRVFDLQLLNYLKFSYIVETVNNFFSG